MSVDLWTMGSVAIHLRHPPSRGALLRTGGYGGQDVKVLLVPIINVEWERVVGAVFRCRCRADIYSSFLPLLLSSTSSSDLELELLTRTCIIFIYTWLL